MFQINLEGTFTKHFQEMTERIKTTQSQMVKVELSPLMELIQETTKKLNTLTSVRIHRFKEFQKLLETISEEAKEIPDHADKIHSYFAIRGWFVPFNSAPLHVFKMYSQLIDEGKDEVIEEKIKDYIKNQIPAIKNNVEKQFADRYKIIKVAFEAHTNKNYILSIPTLLAQADGMFSDLLDMAFYTNNEDKLEDIRRKLLIKLAENDHPTSTTSLGYLLVKQLQEKSIIHEDYDEFKKSMSTNSGIEPLNRNYILHGKALEYDNEPNSLKTISLIGLLCDCKDTFTM